MNSKNSTEISDTFKQLAHDAGFELVGIAPAVSPETLGSFYDWLNNGFAGEMQYIERRREAYAHPESIKQGVASVMMLGMNYKSSPIISDEAAPKTETESPKED